MTSPYYNPEQFGLTIVASEDIAGSYEFDMLIVWKDINEDYYYATDSGCSCPIPFEDVSGVQDITRIEAHSFESFESEAKNYLSPDEIANIRRAVTRSSRVVSQPPPPEPTGPKDTLSWSSNVGNNSVETQIIHRRDDVFTVTTMDINEACDYQTATYTLQSLMDFHAELGNFINLAIRSVGR